MDIIQINNMNFSYKNKLVFKNFNLNIEKNTMVSIIGTNGSGKTTLIKILLGLFSYDGYINIDNCYLNNFNIKKIRSKIGYVTDNIDNQFIGETVLDNLVYTLENLCYSKEEIKKELDYVSSKFRLNNILEMEPFKLNNSQKQLVNIASALIHKPKILIIDEGLHQLNIEDKKLVFKCLKEYKKDNNITIILITHNTEDTIFSDRIIVLDKGNIIIDNDVINVYSNSSLLKKIGIKIPFIIEISNDLKLYNLIKNTYTDMENLVDQLWK